MMLVDDGSDLAESECLSCRQIFCESCDVAPWHAGITCEYRKFWKGYRGVEDMMLLEMAKGKKWERCPKCEFFVEKHDGCLYITCSGASRANSCEDCGEIFGILFLTST